MCFGKKEHAGDIFHGRKYTLRKRELVFKKLVLNTFCRKWVMY